ncbi:MAG: hypothetical protein EHM45_12760 [Desulfobacteraceae bacterium]|nr:MAG: hypothetical protein EHM45_12760 [Desulfobacteraceae bacterium]
MVVHFRELKDANGKSVLDSEGNVKKDEVELERPLCRYYTLFNAQQIAGIPEMEKEKVDWPAEQRADNILRESDAKIFHDQDKSAYYQPAKDEIHMPPKSHFQNSDRYYATALHELGHWTGHQTRLNRDLGGFKGSDQYAREELRAELASYFMSDRLKISNEVENHASYLQSWVKVLKEDKHEIFRASRDAEKITEYVMAYEKEMKCTLSIVDKQNFKTFQITLAVKRDDLDLSNPDALRGFLNQEKEKCLKNLNLNPDKCQFQLKPLEMPKVKGLPGLDR